MPIYLLIILFITLCFLFNFLNKKSFSKYRRPLFTFQQIILISVSICLGLVFLKISNMGKEITTITNITAILTVMLGLISTVIGYAQTGILIGTGGLLYTIIFIPFGALILFGLLKAVIFLVPGVVVIYILMTIFKKK